MKIAVVGAGISGLSAAYYLSKKHKVDLFEKENQFGGHANTIKVAYDHNKEIAVDIGFMVFNKNTYPNLINFFSENKIEIKKVNQNYYEGSAPDVVGIAKGFQYGSAFKFEYSLMVPFKGKNIKVSFDDWIFKQDEEVAINRATLTKFGFKVGELTVFFSKK